MKDLIELTSILSRPGLYRPDFLRAGKGWTERLERFYASLEAKELTTDAEAFHLLFSSEDEKNRYSILKSRLRKRLLQSLGALEIRQPEFSEQSEAYYEVQQLLFWSHVLERFSTGRMSVSLAEDGLALSEEFEMTLPAIGFLQQLLRASSFSGSRKRFAKYSEKLESKLRLLSAEREAVSMYQQLAIEFAKTAGNRPEVLARAERYATRSRELLASGAASYELSLYTYRIETLASQIGQNYERSLEVTAEALGFLDSHPKLSVPARYAEFLTYKLLTELHLRKYDAGERTAARCEELFRPGSSPWFIFREYYFLLAMHTARYAEAKRIYDETTANENFRLLPEDKKERWRIYELYLTYVLRSTRSPLYKPTSRPGVMSLARLLREVPTYARDKKGYNISILVIHILYLLERSDYEEITRRMEALRTYRVRYLKPKTNRQSAVFFKMLTVAERESFDYDRVVKFTEALFERLKRTPSDYTEYEEALQILPYDWLWPHILTLMRKQRKGRKKTA